MNDVRHHNPSRRRPGRGLATGFLSAPQAPGAQQPKGEQTQWCAAAQVRLVLAVERPCVTLGVLGRRISLAPLRSAPTRAVPEHGVALMEEAKTVSQKVAAQHRRAPYADLSIPARSVPLQAMAQGLEPGGMA